MSSLKEIDSRYYNPANLVMLPTKDKSNIKLIDNKYLLFGDFRKDWTNQDEMFQHLYITSDEKIKEGDWCLDIINNSLHKAPKDLSLFIKTCKKIIATTDENLNMIPHPHYSNTMIENIGHKLPQPSQSFIKAYIEAYNNDKPIVKIMVEYENGKLLYNKRICSCGCELGALEDSPHDCCGSYRFTERPIFDKEVLKIDKDNYITIKPIKDSWSRKEVMDLTRKAYGRGYADKVESKGMSGYIEWIEENL